MKFFNFFKNQKEVQNLPDLLKRINRNEIMEYKFKINQEISKKDPLYMRINIEELDYMNEYNKEIGIVKRFLINPFKRNLAKTFDKFRYEKDIYRPNVDLREKYFGVKSKYFKISFISLFGIIIFFSYLIGYVYSRMKYDIYTRRFMYTFLFSYMMAFEYLDYHISEILYKVNHVVPLEMSDKELEFILYKKMRSYFIKRRLQNKIDEILTTDPELFEIENLVKRINK